MATTEREIDLYPPEPLPEAPRRVGVIEAARRHKGLVLAPMLALLLVALVVGVLRSPTYTAETRLNVGRIDVDTASIPGFAEASQILAATYSRAVTATAITERIGRRLGLSSDEVAGRLEGSPTPESAIFVIDATGNSAEAAIQLANTAGTELAAYVKELNESNPNAARLQDEYREAREAVERSASAVNAATADMEANPTTANRRALERAEAELDTNQLVAETVRENYRESRGGQAATDVVQVLSPARTATSDRLPVLQLLMVAALLVGLLVGLALAAFRASRPV